MTIIAYNVFLQYASESGRYYIPDVLHQNQRRE